MSDYMVTESSGHTAIRYRPIVVWIHWVSAALLLTQVWLGFYFHDLPRGSDARMEAFAWHKTVGAVILVLALARLAVRLMNPPPPYPADMARWERAFAVWTHRLFYILLIALPLTGLAAVSGRAEDGTVPLLFGLSLPAIPGIPEENEFGDVHEILVKVTIVLLILHVAGALKHQFMDRGPTADRMPPFRSTRR
jgi:cytochrome b561